MKVKKLKLKSNVKSSLILIIFFALTIALGLAFGNRLNNLSNEQQKNADAQIVHTARSK